MAKKVSAPSPDGVLLEKIGSLHMLMQVYNEHTKEEFQKVREGQDEVKDAINELKKKVEVQNGRVGKLEDKDLAHESLKLIVDEMKRTQENCPGAIMKDEINIYKDEMRPVYVIATNWKLMLLTAVALSLIIASLPKLFTWVANSLSSAFEIGL